MYNKDDLLKSFPNVLKDDVKDKLLLFFDPPTGIPIKAAAYTLYGTKPLPPTKHFGGYTFYYSSDEFPYYARTGQACWGPLGGLKQNQKNLYMWFPSIKKYGDLASPSSPYYSFMKEMFEGMFNEWVDDITRDKFIASYGLVMTPKLLESWPSPVIAGFAINQKYTHGKLTGGSMFEHIMLGLVQPYNGKWSWGESPTWGTQYVGSTWKNIWNVLNGRMNEYVEKLPAYATDSDYSCWDSPVKNLFTEHNIIHDGKFITYRAGDIYWDEWVVRNYHNAGHGIYGRNNGGSLPSNHGEVLSELMKNFGPKFKNVPYAEADTKVRAYILERLKTYDANGNTTQTAKAA